MARNRMIKPEFWTSGTLTRVSRDARLMFIGLWNFADDYGVLENSDRRILGDLFPFDSDVSERDIEKWKDELLKSNLLVLIKHNSHEYLAIRSWTEHQKVAHPSKETIPSSLIHENLTRISRESPAQIEREREREREISLSKKVEFPEEVVKLSDFLFRCIQKNNPGFKGDPRKWDRDFDLMVRVDKRPLHDIAMVTKFCQSDPFWKSNILSGSKLRKQFDQLLMKSKEFINNNTHHVA